MRYYQEVRNYKTEAFLHQCMHPWYTCISNAEKDIILFPVQKQKCQKEKIQK